MSTPSASADRARTLDALLREGLTRIAVTEDEGLPRLLAEVDALLAELVRIRPDTIDLLPWPPDAAERLEVCRTELQRLGTGRVRRRDAVAKIRLLLPRFTTNRS